MAVSGTALVLQGLSAASAAVTAATGASSISSEERDAVTALQLPEISEIMLAGHASGRVVLWDVVAGVVLKEVTDVHELPVSHLRFLHSS